MSTSRDHIREATFERSLPSDGDSERAILGAVLLDNEIIIQARNLLTAADFYVPSHRRIYEAMLALSEVGSEINAILIGNELRKANALESVGGLTFITSLTYGLPHSTNIAHYAQIVKGKSSLRLLIKAANKITQEALDEDDLPEVILNNAQQAIFDLGAVSTARKALSMREITENAARVITGFVRGENPGLASPWQELDNLCRGGIQESELWGLAALAKAGKSAVMKQWAQKLGSEGRRVLIFTREMSEVKILFRMLAAVTGIPASQIRYGLDESRVLRLLSASAAMADFPIFIDSVTSDVNDMRAKVREMIRSEGIEIVFADYLQLFHSGKKTDNRATEIGHVWRTMKDTAQDFNTRVVALAQFNRAAYQSDKRPMFHQVEGSGEGEKAVDVGMVLWTDNEGGAPGARPATIYIDYQRDESSGTEVQLTFDGQVMEFQSDFSARRKINFND